MGGSGYRPDMASPTARGDLDIQASEVRQRIAAAGRELFAVQGYERTTVEAIAERAGIARRTFFRHFRAKDDVIFPDHDRVAQAVPADSVRAAGLPTSPTCSNACPRPASML